MRSRVGRRLPVGGVLPLLALVACACGGTAGVGPRSAVTDAAKDGPKAPPFVTPARVVALPDASLAAASVIDSDGSQRLIVQGMRISERVDGSIERARQVFPAGRQIRTLELPDRLGGGHLFYTDSAGASQIWRAKSWSGELEPLANLDADVETIVDGFDRLYVLDRRAFEVLALDPRSGKLLDAGALPAAPAYTALAFADAWRAAVEVPFRGVLVTFDAGASWQPLPLSQTYGLELSNGEIVVNTAGGKYVIERSGALRLHDGRASGAALFRGAGGVPLPTAADGRVAEAAEPAPRQPPGPLGRRPLRAAVLHGWPDSPSTAVVAENGALGRVRLSDGKLLDVDERARLDGSCHGIRLGDGFGFVCAQERGATSIYQFEPPLSLRPVLRFDGPRFVAASGNGGLVVRGRCKGPAEIESGAYCIVAPDGTRREIRVRGDVGVERVVALGDGRSAVLVPPRLGAPGLLTLVDTAGHASGVKLKLPKTEGPTLALLKKGLWLDGFVEHKPGELAGWVVSAGPFVGVRVKLDGTVRVGKIENDIDRVLLSGPLALVLGRAGLAAETTDGGFSWREVDLPADTAHGARPAGTGSAEERGCSRVGCAFGSWLRVGWRGKKSDKPELETVEPPAPTSGLALPTGRWQLACVPTGASEGPRDKQASAPPPPRAPRYPSYYGHYGGMYGATTTPGPDAVENGPWARFMGAAPPNKKPGDVGFDYGTEHAELQLRGYAWGARGAAWDRVGSWVVRAYDRFSLERAIWSTVTTRTPWPDMVTAAQTFGQDLGMGMASSWSAALEPNGRGAVLLINSRGTLELFLAEEGRSITPIEDAQRWGIAQISGAVKLGSTWYVGSMLSGSAFRIFRIDGNRIDLFSDYPLRSSYRGSSTLMARVVRSQRGDALGIWADARKTRAAASSWYVYPVDLETGRADEPLELAAQVLAQTPAVCGPEADGWLLEGEAPIMPYLDFAGGADAVRSRKVEARLLVSAFGVCIEALSAQAETDVPDGLGRGDTSAWTASGRASAPLVLSDRARVGRRWGFRCAPEPGR
jgi:hypothetical protein